MAWNEKEMGRAKRCLKKSMITGNDLYSGKHVVLNLQEYAGWALNDWEAVESGGDKMAAEKSTLASERTGYNISYSFGLWGIWAWCQWISGEPLGNSAENHVIFSHSNSHSLFFVCRQSRWESEEIYILANFVERKNVVLFGTAKGAGSRHVKTKPGRSWRGLWRLLMDTIGLGMPVGGSGLMRVTGAGQSVQPYYNPINYWTNFFRWINFKIYHG